ncbi:3-dehydroquinate synthase [Flexithrix dorotheae]|uniref:3-dehydroquinate synthase n=1 Tax=Flexithrix dorotheae TaxID=70993 RepID=UPI0005C66426|nr:3-dehydroquinate synthase [Flexithrix dorotheae]
MESREITSGVFIVSKFSKDVFSFLENFTKIAVIFDENSKKYCYPLIKEFIPENHLTIQIQSGEENKNLETCKSVWDKLTENSFDRKSIVLNLGGGVIGDMGGFCAATYKRGISFVQIPTTLLSQVDASVGGKLGIDFNGFKNHIGVFQLPERVLVHPGFIKTLVKEELRSGYAEVIKHFLIADKEKWDLLKQKQLSAQNFDQLIPENILIKNQVVTSDPKEKGLRKILNFGHTIGHAIETHLLFQKPRKLLHGEAIAIGMICETYLSQKLLGLSESDLKEVSDYILQTYGKVELNFDDIDQILPLMQQDKKNEGNRLNFSLLEYNGKAVFDQEISEDMARESLLFYNSL